MSLYERLYFCTYIFVVLLLKYFYPWLCVEKTPFQDKWRTRVGENQLKMASIEQLNNNIETKLRLIKFTQEQAEKSLGSKNVLAITRQIKTLTAKVSEVHEIKVKI